MPRRLASSLALLALLLGAPPAAAVLLVGGYVSGSSATWAVDETSGALLYPFIPVAGALKEGPDGAFWVVEAAGIRRYDAASGLPLGLAIPEGGALSLGDAADFLFAGDDVIVSDRGYGALRVFDATSYAFLETAVAGSGFETARGLAFTPTGGLLISSFDTDQVFRYNAATGKYNGIFTSGGGGLDKPRGIVFGPDGLVYVSHSLLPNRVFRYTATGGFVDAIGAVVQPAGLVFGPDGLLYVGSETYSRVFQVDPTGGTTLTFATGLDEPAHLVFGPDGNLYVANRGTADVRRFDGTTGAFIDVFATPPAGFLDVEGLAFGADGDLYVVANLDLSAFQGGRVLRFDGTSGSYLGEFATTPPARELAFGPAGDLYVTSQLTNAVERYDGTTGDPLGTFATGRVLESPGDVELDAGRLLVDDPARDQVVLFTYPGFDVIGAFGYPGPANTDATIGPDGAYYQLNSATDDVRRYDPATGAVVDIFASGGISIPRDLAFSPGGELQVLEESTHEILRFDGTTGAALGALPLGVLPGPLFQYVYNVGHSALPTQLPGVTTLARSSNPRRVAVDGAGTPWFISASGDQLVRVDSPGSTTVLLDASGAGGASFQLPQDVIAAPDGTVYAAASYSDNVFRVDPDGTAGEILGPDTPGLSVESPVRLAMDAAGDLFVSLAASDNVVKRTPGGVWSEILGPAGDGAGHVLDSPNGLAVDAAGNVYVAGFYSDNVFKVEPGGGVSLVLDASSVPGAPLSYPDSLAVDSAGTLYVGASSYVFQVTPGGEASVILDESILGTGNVGDLVVDEFDNLYVAYWTGPVLQRTPWGSVAVLLDEHGGGAGALMESPAGLAVDTAGAVYVAAYWSDNVLRVDSVPECSDGIDNDGDGAIDLADDTGCENPFDRSEQSGYAVCDDGLDNDGDGAIDFPDDAGCRNRAWTYENPACDDDVDNDSDGTIDWDGGSGGAAPDANCVYPWQTRENKKACGLGFEMAPLLAWLWARRRRRRRA